MTLSKTTKDHDEIRKWADSRGAVPAEVSETERNGGTGILRFEFKHAPNRNDSKLQEIPWDEFFEKFDENDLELVYQEKTADGEKSNFNKLVHPDSEEHSSRGKSHSASSGSSHSGQSNKSDSRDGGDSHSSGGKSHSSNSSASHSVTTSTAHKTNVRDVDESDDVDDLDDTDDIDDIDSDEPQHSGNRSDDDTDEERKTSSSRSGSHSK